MAVVNCPHCGAAVHIENVKVVRSGHNASSDKPREWVIREGGREVHRCPDSE